jgi:hypothetical protein
VGKAKRAHRGEHRVGTARNTRLCPPYAPVDHFGLAILDTSQIKGFAPQQTPKVEKVHILYDWRDPSLV